MAYFCLLAGHETAKVARRGVAHLSAELPSFAALFASIFQTAVRLMDADPEDDTASHRVLLSVFAPGGVIPEPYNCSAYEENQFVAPRGVTVPTEHRHAAQFLGTVTGGLARTLQTGAERGTPSEEASEEGPPPVRRGTPDEVTTLADALEQMRDGVSESRRGLLDQIIEHLTGAEDEIADMPSLEPAALVSSSAVAQIVNVIELLFREIFDSYCPGHDFDGLFDDAIADLEASLPLATLVSATGSGISPSSRSIGNHVHRVLQDRYERAEAGFSDIISEMQDRSATHTAGSRHPAASQAICVVGPTTSGRRENIRALLSPRRDPDHFFRCANSAFSMRVDPISRGGITIRPDLINKRTCELWEIKPVRAAAEGVIQSARYRLLFNLMREVFTCLGVVRPHRLQPGGDIESISTFALAPINVDEAAGEPAIAIPLQILPTLGTLVLYVVLRFSEGVAGATVISLLYDGLARRLREERDRAAREGSSGGGAEEPVRARSRVFEDPIFIIAVLLFIIILAILLAVELAALAVLAAALAAIGLIVDGIDESLGELSAGLSGWNRTFTPRASGFGFGFTPPPGAAPVRLATVRMFGARVDGFPENLVGSLLTAANGIYPAAKQLQERYLLENARALRGGSGDAVA
jgi:hypothetical protein